MANVYLDGATSRTVRAEMELTRDPETGGADPTLTCLVCKRESCDWEYTFPRLVLGARVTVGLHDGCANTLDTKEGEKR